MWDLNVQQLKCVIYVLDVSDIVVLPHAELGAVPEGANIL